MRRDPRLDPLAATGLLGAAIVLAGCRNAPPPRALPEVGIVVLQPERAVLSTELPGRTSPYQVAEIRPQVSGLIQKRLFEEGAEVAAGSVLYQIDPAPYQAALDQAVAALESAEASLPAVRARAERTRKLAVVHAVGEQDADEAEAAGQRAVAAVTAARAAVESARFNLANTPIKAPISGRSGRSAVTEGALVAAYQPVALTTVQRLDPIYVDVTQSSADLLRLRRRIDAGQLRTGGGSARKARLVLEDGVPYPQPGLLQFRDVTVDPSTGAVTLRLVFPNPRHVLLPGMFVRAVVEEGVDERAILAPQQGVTRDAKGNAVALVLAPGDQVELRVLSLDRAVGNAWLVTAGLAAGDRLIVEGMQKVRPGMPARGVPWQPAPAAAGK